MNKEKQFDCVNFKNELQKNLLEKSGAKSIQEYVEYVNRIAQNSSLNKAAGSQPNLYASQK